VDALTAQISLLKHWRAQNLLRIADRYIAAEESGRRSMEAKARIDRANLWE
jgi:hypothetical protein